jgi:hypothetical protein
MSSVVRARLRNLRMPRSQTRAVALSLPARSTSQFDSTPRFDYLKLVVWIAGGLVPWAAIAALLFVAV